MWEKRPELLWREKPNIPETRGTEFTFGPETLQMFEAGIHRHIMDMGEMYVELINPGESYGPMTVVPSKEWRWINGRLWTPASFFIIADRDGEWSYMRYYTRERRLFVFKEQKPIILSEGERVTVNHNKPLFDAWDIWR